MFLLNLKLYGIQKTLFSRTLNSILQDSIGEIKEVMCQIQICLEDQALAITGGNLMDIKTLHGGRDIENQVKK